MAGWAGYNMSNELLNLFYRGVSISIGGTLYLRLLVAPSSRSGGGTETNYTNYTRLALPRNTSIFSAPANGQLTNSTILTFPSAGSLGNGSLVWFDIVDTASGSFTKLYNGGPINPPKEIVVGKEPKFRAGSLVITF